MKSRNRFEWMLITLLCASGCVQHYNEIELLNDNILGQSAKSQTPIILQHRGKDSIMPETVNLDFVNGRIDGVTVDYPCGTSFEAVRRTINSYYKDSERKTFSDDPVIGLWRVEGKGFAIQLSKDEYDKVRLIYLLIR